MIDSGERQAFEHMPAVEVGMAVERALDRCLSQVQVEASGGRPRVSSRSRLSQQGGGGGPPGAGGRALGPTSRKARIPSWVHLQAMGIAAHKRSMSADKMAQEGTGDGWRDMNGRSGREPSARASTPSRPASPGSPTAQADDTDLADLDDEVAVAEALMQRKAHLWDPLLPGASEKYDCLSSLDVIAPRGLGGGGCGVASPARRGSDFTFNEPTGTGPGLGGPVHSAAGSGSAAGAAGAAGAACLACALSFAIRAWYSCVRGARGSIGGGGEDARPSGSGGGGCDGGGAGLGRPLPGLTASRASFLASRSFAEQPTHE